MASDLANDLSWISFGRIAAIKPGQQVFSMLSRQNKIATLAHWFHVVLRGMIPTTQKSIFKEIFDANYERLCTVAYRIVKDQDEARDIVQQVMCDFWENRNKWPEICSYSAYLYTTVYRFSVLSYKKLTVSKNGKLSSEDLNAGFTPPDELAYKELEEQIINAINTLPPKCKEIFVLSREEELSYKEIADQLQISVKTVEAQMGIALKRLRTALDSTDYGSLFFSVFF